VLSDSPVVAVVAVKDLAAAKGFYGEVLGLRESEESDPGGVLYQCDGMQLLVYESSFAGTNEATAASWNVSEIEQEVASLAERGVTFEHYELPGATREGDIHLIGSLKSVWFKDADGNILNLVNRG
jgi:catechol 2,3-dioxygenase-like lactoylglutathione lyase family enzyme